MNFVKEYWAIGVALVALVGFFYVSDYRLGQVEDELKTHDLKRLSWQVTQLKCEVRNIKKVLQQKPETDCDP